MKTKIILASLVGILLGTYASAASLSLSPLNVSVRPGQTFNVVVTLNPQGKIYSAKVVVRFSPDVIAVKQNTSNQSFTLGPNWMAPEGVAIDNSAGTVSMLAGYPRGTETTVLFGTISFVAKKSGTGTISIGNESIALGADNKNALSGSVSLVNVSVVASTPTPTPALSGTVVTPTPTPSPEASIAAETPSAEPSAQQATLLGTIGSVLNLGTGNRFVGLIMILVITYGAYWLIKRALKNKNK